VSGFISCAGFRHVEKIIFVCKFFGAVKTKAALSATIGTNRHEEQDPIFQNPTAFGAMHVHASTPGAGLFRVVDEESENTPHRKSIIPRTISGRNDRRDDCQFG
jgi:hypothetical protein